MRFTINILTTTLGALTLAAGMALASGSEVEITGVIQSIGASSLIVDGNAVLTDGSTVFEDSGDQQVSFGALMVGDLVEVHGSLVAGGAIMADRIKVEDEAEAEEVELTGVISSIDTNTIVVGGTTFLFNSHTVFLAADGSNIDSSALSFGSRVEVKATRQGDGSFLATRIKIEDDENENEVEFEASLQSIENNSLIVMGRTVKVTRHTEIEGNRNRPISFDDLRVGVDTLVRGTDQGDGSVLASYIRSAVSPAGGGHGHATTGTITSKGRNFLKLGTRKFTVQRSTKIEDADSNRITFADLLIGMRVRVEYRKSGATFLATEINVQP